MPSWGKLQCRRFAANLNAPHMLERVEFAWFENNRLLVTVSTSPAIPGSQLMSACELYFFDSIASHSTPQGSPALTVRISDVALCAFCKQAPKGECKCIRDSSSMLLFPVSPPVGSGLHTPLLPSSSSSPLPWKSYLQLLSQSKQNGFLTSLLITPDAKDEPMPRVRVRRAYSLTFGTQEAINEGIHLRLKQMLLARPAPPAAPRPSLAKLDWQPAWAKPRRDLNACLGALRGSNGRRGDETEHSARKTTGTESIAGGDDMSTTVTQITPPPSAWMHDPLPSPDSVVPLSDCTERRGMRVKDGIPVASTESILNAPNTTDVRVRMKHRRNGIVPAKDSKDVSCSAETTPNPFLSTILNPSKDASTSTLANFAEMSAIMPPIPLPSKSTACLFSGTPTHDDHDRDVAASALTLGLPSPIRKGGASCVLPSPISMILDYGDESARKRARFDVNTGTKDDVLALGFDTAAWDDSVDDTDRLRRLREPFAWTPPPPPPERPHSALGRALGFERVPSPYGAGGSGANSGNVAGVNVAVAMGMTNGFAGMVRADSVARSAGSAGSSGSGGRGRAGGARCDECGATFSKRANLVRHTKTVHNNVKPFACATCASRFGLKADLQRHMRNIHEKRAFCCRACGRSFAAQDELDFHCRVAHEKDLRPFECEQCGMKFGRRSSRRRHEQTVHTEKRFDCTMCDKSYSQRFDAIKHGRKAHGIERVVN